jgi:hypothetical protein
VGRQQDEIRDVVVMREECGGIFRGGDFLSIQQGRLMQWGGRGFFTDGDIEQIGHDTEDEETQSAGGQPPASRK